MQRRFQLVDVFSDQSFSGNPLAVILDAEGLTSEEMQKITRWMNLSETAFLLPATHSGADYHVRIFTLEKELPFAGHPTLGSCHAWLTAGGQAAAKTDVIQECGVGLVTIRRTKTDLAFAAPDLIRAGPVSATKLAEIAHILQIDRQAIVDAQWADNGPGWVVVLLDSAQAVLDIKPLPDSPTSLYLGLVGPYADRQETAFEIRALYTDQQGALREDPVTGSLNASVAQWLIASKRACAPYRVSQGACVGRSGRIEISQDSDGVVWVGGCTRTLIEGCIA